MLDANSLKVRVENSLSASGCLDSFSVSVRMATRKKNTYYAGRKTNGVLKQAARLRLVAIRNSHESLSDPRRRIIGIDDLGPVEGVIGKFRVSVVQVEKPEVGPRSRILEPQYIQKLESKEGTNGLPSNHIPTLL